MQDLREVNARVETVHPKLPKPNTLLSLLPPEHQVYIVLELQDAFFAIPLAPISQPIFAFQWSDPESGDTSQLTWSHLFQGFKNFPALFGKSLQNNLAPYHLEHPDLTLLQYVDDLLLASQDYDSCLVGTKDLL